MLDRERGQRHVEAALRERSGVATHIGDDELVQPAQGPRRLVDVHADEPRDPLAKRLQLALAATAGVERRAAVGRQRLVEPVPDDLARRAARSPARGDPLAPVAPPDLRWRSLRVGPPCLRGGAGVAQMRAARTSERSGRLRRPPRLPLPRRRPSPGRRRGALDDPLLLEPALGVDRRLAAVRGGGDRLPVAVVVHVAGDEDALDVGVRLVPDDRGSPSRRRSASRGTRRCWAGSRWPGRARRRRASTPRPSRCRAAARRSRPRHPGRRRLPCSTRPRSWDCRGRASA